MMQMRNASSEEVAKSNAKKMRTKNGCIKYLECWPTLVSCHLFSVAVTVYDMWLLDQEERGETKREEKRGETRRMERGARG